MTDDQLRHNITTNDTGDVPYAGRLRLDSPSLFRNGETR